MREVGEAILQRSAYAAQRLAALPGVKIPFRGFFKEFVVDFTGTGKSVARDQSRPCARKASSAARICRPSSPSSGQSALYCVTEIHSAG